MTSKQVEFKAEPGNTSFTTRRVVQAPRELVFSAFTEPAHVKQWMGPPSVKMVTCDIDLRVGGKYRFAYRAPNGTEVGFHGEYREITADRLVRTFGCGPGPRGPGPDPDPNREAVDTLTLEADDKQTTIKTVSVHKSVEARDWRLASGGASGALEAGMIEAYTRLDALLATLQKQRPGA